MDAPTLSGVLNPNLSRGSTALHIAAARGHAACVSALLESQAAIPGEPSLCHIIGLAAAVTGLQAYKFTPRSLFTIAALDAMQPELQNVWTKLQSDDRKVLVEKRHTVISGVCRHGAAADPQCKGAEGEPAGAAGRAPLSGAVVIRGSHCAGAVGRAHLLRHAPPAAPQRPRQAGAAAAAAVPQQPRP